MRPFGHAHAASFLMALAVGTFALRLNCPVAIADPPTNSPTGFSVHKNPQAVTEAFEDFERYRDKKVWEKADAAFAKILDAKPTGLAQGKDGFFISSSQKVRDELLSLPAEGREAYRLFNDSKAEQLFRDAVARSEDVTGGRGADGPPVDDAAMLKQVVDGYFITSVGDRAADRLGDAFFEAGNFDGAAQCWRMVLDNYPDTTLSPPLLQTKLAIALARSGHWADFQAVCSLVHDRYAGQTVSVGGQDVTAADYLDKLAKDEFPAQEPAAQSSNLSVSSLVAGDEGPSISLPSSHTPLWQIPLIDSDLAQQLQAAMSQFGWQFIADQITKRVPPTAVDKQRIYVNCLGNCFAADLKTGKMIWRTDPIPNLAQSLSQSMMQGQSPDFDAFSVTPVGDRVFFVRKSLANQAEPTQLLCLNAATGKPIWTFQSAPRSGWNIFGGGSGSTWSFLGKPLIVGNLVWACAHAENNQELNLLCINLDKGNLLWSVVLGTPSLSTDFRGQPQEKVPVLFENQGKIDVLTNNGALLDVDPATQSVDWAFTYPTTVPQGQQMFFFNQAMPSDPTPPGTMLARDSTLYFKEETGDTLYALDLAGPSLKWKRLLDSTVTLIACDDDHLWVAGAEVDCIDLQSRDMQWSDKLSTATGSITPLLDRQHLYVFGQRGVHDIDTRSGDAGPVFHGYDRDSLGGTLWQTSGQLISVSNLAATAYPLDRGKQP